MEVALPGELDGLRADKRKIGSNSQGRIEHGHQLNRCSRDRQKWIGTRGKEEKEAGGRGLASEIDPLTPDCAKARD